MTAKQRSLYFAKWNRLRSALTDFGEFSPAEAEEERKQIHLDTLGSAKSSKDLTNADFDKVLDAFEERLVILDGPRSQTRGAVHPRLRLVYSIEALKLPEAYLEKIARDQFRTSDWRKLSLSQMTAFRYTATTRARALSKKGGAA